MVREERDGLHRVAVALQHSVQAGACAGRGRDAREWLPRRGMKRQRDVHARRKRRRGVAPGASREATSGRSHVQLLRHLSHSSTRDLQEASRGP